MAPLPQGLYERYAALASAAVEADYDVRDGSTLTFAMEHLGLGLRTGGLAVIDCLTAEGGVDLLRPGAVVKAFWADRDKTELLRVEYCPAAGGPPIVARPDGRGGFWRQSLALPPLTVASFASGQVATTLWDAAAEAGLDGPLMESLAAVVAPSLDVLTDVRPGDSFQALYNRVYDDGRPRGEATLEAFTLVCQGTNREFYRYVNTEGAAGYYNERQQAASRPFLASPLQFAQVAPRHRDGVAKEVLGAEGVDYRVAAGTPVVAVAAGTVTQTGWNGGLGRQVAIGHGDGLATVYSHLESPARGLKAGSRVAQGEVIGYVGATGASATPVLNFRLKRNNVLINPETFLARQEGEALAGADAQAFAQIVTRVRNRLRELAQK